MTFQSCCLPDAGYDDGGGHVCWDDEGYYTWKSCCEQPLQGWRAEVQRNFKQITVEELFQAELERLGEKYRTYYQRRISYHRLMHCVEQFELDGNFKALSGLHHRDFGKPDICRRKIWPTHLSGTPQWSKSRPKIIFSFKFRLKSYRNVSLTPTISFCFRSSTGPSLLRGQVWLGRHLGS